MVVAAQPQVLQRVLNREQHAADVREVEVPVAVGAVVPKPLQGAWDREDVLQGRRRDGSVPDCQGRDCRCAAGDREEVVDRPGVPVRPEGHVGVVAAGVGMAASDVGLSTAV